MHPRRYYLFLIEQPFVKILKANQIMEDKCNHIYLFGAENRLYVHHKLKDLNFEKFWKGKYPKSLPLKYNDKD